MNALLVDAVLLVLLAVLVVVGYRQGLIVGALSIVGFAGAGLVALLTVSWALSPFGWFDDNPLVRTIVLGVVALAAAVAGQAGMMALGYRLRAHLHRRSLRRVDSIVGAVVPGTLMLVLVWFIAGALQGVASPDLNVALGRSQVLSAIDQLSPWEAAQPVGGVRSWLEDAGITDAFGGLTSDQVQSTDPPDPQVAQLPAVIAASQSVVRVTGFADACLQSQEGSGFVAAPGRVITNAHVVAGMQSAGVQVGGTGRTYPAQIVVFDPTRDLAVLAVDGLDVPPLDLGVPHYPGDSVVLAGYPLDGPLQLGAARVRARVTTTGPDIYGDPGAQRAIYSLYAHVEQGNSGGPLLSTEGDVLGVVVSRSADDPTTGYALRLAELRPVVEEAADASQPVSTGGCAAG